MRFCMAREGALSSRLSAQLKGAIEHFASKAALNINRLGKKTVAQLIDRGLVKDLSNMLSIDF